MALIYASAVNKRMNAGPRHKRSLADTPPNGCIDIGISHSRVRSADDSRALAAALAADRQPTSSCAHELRGGDKTRMRRVRGLWRRALIE